jgi:hypothetical protein
VRGSPQQPAVVNKSNCFDALTLNASGGRDKVQYSSRNFQFLESIIRFRGRRVRCVQYIFVRSKIYLCLRHHNTSRRDPRILGSLWDSEQQRQRHILADIKMPIKALLHCFISTLVHYFLINSSLQCHIA